MSETTSQATGAEPTESWYRESTGSMPASPVPAPGFDPAGPGDQPDVEASAPAVRQAHWSGKKAAVAAALAVGLTSVGVLGATAVVQEAGGTTVDGPAGSLGRHRPAGGQAPTGQVPNGQLGPLQPGQLGQPNQQFPGQLPQPLSPPDDDSGDSTADDDSARTTDA